jgi:hypothetical protein
MTKFIKLNAFIGELEFMVNPMMICGITRYSDFTVVHTMGGHPFNVKETPEEITKLIKESEKFVITTK